MPYTSFAKIVHAMPLFAGVAEQERDALLQQGRMRHVSRGEYLFRCGDPVLHFYIICRGNMQLHRETPDGKEITTAVEMRGRTVGKLEILKAFTLHTVSASAINAADVLEFPAEWLRNVARHPVISLNILAAVSQYAHMVEVEAEQRSTMGVAQRVGCFLQRLCVMHGLDPSGFELPYSKVLIASRLGMEPETFSRALSTLKEHGIKIENNRISLCDAHTLETYICDHCSMVGKCETHKKISALQ